MLYINYTQNILGFFKEILVKKITSSHCLALIDIHRVLDILPNRSQVFRKRYVVAIHRYCLCLLQNGTQVIDRCHLMRQMVWAFDKVRKRIQQIYGKKYRLLLNIQNGFS